MAKTRYRIEYDIGIIDKLRRLPKIVRERIKKAIEERLRIAPLEFGKPLLREWKSFRRIRVGDYRVIYKVIEDKVMVFIVEIDHRKDVYE